MTGVPADVIRELAHDYARADRAQICWTLGITEHHNAVDNVLALINLALLTGHVGRYGSGLNPLRGQNNVQGGGDMGAIPNRLPGFQDVETDDEARAVRGGVGRDDRADRDGLHLTEMFEAMERGELTALYVHRREPGAVRGRRRTRQASCSTASITWSCRTSSCTATAELADVVLPAAASWCETEGTVTNSERRVQRCRTALDPPGEARDDTRILIELAARLGHDWRASRRRGDLGRVPLARAQPRGHELQAAGGARRHPVAVLHRGHAEPSLPARPAVEGARSRARPRSSTPSRTCRPSTG